MTRDELRSAQFGATFHYAPACKRTIGPKGGVRVVNETWRINGAMIEPKRSPTEFKRPVKHGLRAYGCINHHNVANFVPAHECPVCTTITVEDC